MIDLDAYFERIGYGGERVPTLATLQTIHRLHPRAVPFENLNPLLRWPVRLDAASLERKLVHEGRGGYCFEHNLLLRHVLEALGFHTTGLAARVVWTAPAGVVRPRSHMLLRVEVEGDPYVADVGFGGLTLTAPLRLLPDAVQSTPHEPFRLREANDAYVLEVNVRDVWSPLYCFDLAEQHLVDYELTNWYLTHHPDSHFLQRLTAARADADRRYALRNAELAVHHRGGVTERRTLSGAAQLREVLEGVFNLRLPDAPELDAILDRLTSTAEQAAAPA